jgi:hypothetical protein
MQEGAHLGRMAFQPGQFLDFGARFPHRCRWIGQKVGFQGRAVFLECTLGLVERQRLECLHPAVVVLLEIAIVGRLGEVADLEGLLHADPLTSQVDGFHFDLDMRVWMRKSLGS